MQRKVFWLSFTALGIIADLALPFWWAVAATIPCGMAAWWIAYRSDWFYPAKPRLIPAHSTKLSAILRAILSCISLNTEA